METLPAPADDRPVAPEPRRGFRLGLGGTFVLSLAVVTAFLAFVLVRCQRMAIEAPLGVVSAFRDVFQLQPRVTVNERVILNQSTDILELAVLSREVEVERETETAWMNSIKRVKVRGTYRVKVGFDLTQPFSVDLSSDPATPARVTLPAPRILGVEALHTEVLALDNGLWNRVKPANVEEELNALPQEARRKAWRAGMLREVQDATVRKLSERFGPPGVTVTIVPAAPPELAKP